MRTRFGFGLALALAATATLASIHTTLAAESGTRPVAVTLGPGSDLWIEGTSTVHDFQAHAKRVAVEARRESATATSRAELLGLFQAGTLRDVVLHVPVTSLHTGKEAMDKNLLKAMKAEHYPEVVFRVTGAPPTFATHADTTTIQVNGTLTIVAATHPITLEVRAHRAGPGVWIEGSYALRMSEYGIKPPTMMLGTLRVGDRVTVRYRLLLIPGGDAAAASPVTGQ